MISVKRRLSFELFFTVAVFIIAVYILTPRFWEPGGESWKVWASSRILRDTGGFPVFSHGPLYVIYLSLFSILKYPFSMQLEFLVTHLFTYMAIFIMLKTVLPRAIAFLLSCAWIPALSVVEGGTMVAGMGCLALYLAGRNDDDAKCAEYFPVSLTAAVFCHSAYVFFLIGHCLGVFLQRLRLKLPKLNLAYKFDKKQVFKTLLKIFLSVLVILVLFFPSKRWDHNHPLCDTKYFPVISSDPLTTAFFQIGNWKYVTRTVPRDKFIYQDWYFTKEKAFGKATTIFQAFISRPDTVLRNIAENAIDFVKLPEKFFSDNFHSPFTVVAIIFFLIGLLGLMTRLLEDGLAPVIFSVLIGSMSIIAVFFLTWFSQRYYLSLLPVALLIFTHTGYGIKYLSKILLKEGSKRKLILLGSSLIITGILINVWNKLMCLPSGYVLRSLTKLKIFLSGLLFIVCGILLLIFIAYRPKFITRVFNVLSLNNHPYFNSAVAVASACCILLATPFIHGQSAQFKAVLKNQSFLSGASPVSMVKAYPELIGSINKKSDILALEDTWIKGFTDVELNNIYNIFTLPPFLDSSEDVQKFLNKLDVVWVSYDFSNPEPSVSTQVYLRYYLHVAPFLKEMQRKGWTAQDVEGYGRIYCRPLGR